MYKDFDLWNEKKRLLETANANHFIKEREIWWCSIGINVASESCGKGSTFRRPVLVIKKLSKTTCYGIPLSTEPKFGSWFVKITVLNRDNYVLLHQMRMFSINRFQRRMMVVEELDFFRVKQKLEQLLEF